MKTFSLLNLFGMFYCKKFNLIYFFISLNREKISSKAFVLEK